MPEFLAEFYLPKSASATVDAGAARARHAAGELAAGGTPIRFIRSIFLPDDETCFFLFEADTVNAVHDAAARAGLRFDHIAAVGAPPT
jgi:hypothetical protein